MKYQEGYKLYDTELKPLARKMRLTMTPAEKIFWQAIRKKAIEKCLFLRQKPVLTYIADFYCAELLLIIEIDGSSHDHKIEMDVNRTMELNEYGYTVVRYMNKQVTESLPRVVRHLTRVVQYLRKRMKKCN
jgi:very-short-patch-repair endonuclease